MNNDEIKNIAIISSNTYRASTPDYENCLGYYGSEQYHAVLAKGLLHTGKFNQVHFIASHGSEPIGIFHPTMNFNGRLSFSENLNEYSMENIRGDNNKSNFNLDKFYYNNGDGIDFIIDMSALMLNTDMLYQYRGFRDFCCYRNGYAGYDRPTIHPINNRNYVVPSIQNRDLFLQDNSGKGGTDKLDEEYIDYVYYGIPDFYDWQIDENKKDRENEYYFDYFSKYYDLCSKEYFLFPHRPTADKGIDIVLELAKYMSGFNFNKKFVIAGAFSNTIEQHRESLMKIKERVGIMNLADIVKFVDIPENPKHHYYKRSLMANAVAVLSPFNPYMYKEGFGLANAESVAIGTPLIITDSISTRELWIDELDSLHVNVGSYEDSMSMYGVIQFAKTINLLLGNVYDLNPKNRYPVDDYVNGYIKIMNKIFQRNKISKQEKQIITKA